MILGKIKFWSDRVRAYFVGIQSIMVAYLFFDKVGWTWWYFVLGIIFIICIYFVDRRWIYPGESAESMKHNPEWQKIQKQILEK